MRRRRSLLFLDVLAVGLVVAGLAALAFRGQDRTAPTGRVIGAVAFHPTGRPARGHPKAVTGYAGKPRVPRGAPSRVAIPAIGVDAAIVRLGVNPDGTLEVPADFGVAGWYRLGPKPGELGSAVIVGHVDSNSGPAVFYRLGRLGLGARVRVSWRADASVLFSVYAVREYAKSAFPTSLVYGQTRRPELRLVTCGGRFDEQSGHYLDNVVVFARRVSAVQGRRAMAPGGVEPPHADSKSAALIR
jgi:hypothetical protein